MPVLTTAVDKVQTQTFGFGTGLGVGDLAQQQPGLGLLLAREVVHDVHDLYGSRSAGVSSGCAIRFGRVCRRALSQAVYKLEVSRQALSLPDGIGDDADY